MTGWRDPFLSPWLRLSHLLSLPPDTIYLMISGGLRDLGPTLFLYSLHPNADPSSKEGWTYLGPLIRPTISPARPRSSWTGDRGWNWECSSFFEVEERSVAVLSAEGYFREKLPEEEVDPAVVEKGAEPEKNPRWQLWFAGPLSSPARSREGATKAHRRGTAEMDIKLEGVLDWGDLYAAQTFLDNSGRRLMWGEQFTSFLLKSRIDGVKAGCRMTTSRRPSALNEGGPARYLSPGNCSGKPSRTSSEPCTLGWRIYLGLRSKRPGTRRWYAPWASGRL